MTSTDTASDTTSDDRPELTPEKLAEIERKYDPETAFRPTGPILGAIISALLVAMSVYHIYAAGFGLIRELLHRGIHISFVLGLVFLLFGWRRAPSTDLPAQAWWRVGGIPILDMVFAVLAVASAMYLPLLPPEALAVRVGNPSQLDVFMGTALLILTLEATRRSVGPTLPLIALVFVLFALFGPWAPGLLKHGGTSWLGLINHLYMTNQGIYGIAIGVMAKYVFLFIVFGVLATRIGLGQLFIDIAMVIAGRYSGGPAKVAIFSSAFMGTISGSSIANTVTTGALTIPAMKKVGYPPHFAGAVEATASTGGQITPPILGAAAFIMVEYLEIPLRDVLAAALFPAMLHYFGIFIMVHLEAKRLGLRGLKASELPKMGVVLRQHWLSIIPLVLLVYMILNGWTPDYAAVYGIFACIVVGVLNPVNRSDVRGPLERSGSGGQEHAGRGCRCGDGGRHRGCRDPDGRRFPVGICRGPDGQRYRRRAGWALALQLLRGGAMVAVHIADPDRHRLHHHGRGHSDNSDVYHPRRRRRARAGRAGSTAAGRALLCLLLRRAG